jgi:hypothetical protein
MTQVKYLCEFSSFTSPEATYQLALGYHGGDTFHSFVYKLFFLDYV